MSGQAWISPENLDIFRQVWTSLDKSRQVREGLDRFKLGTSMSILWDITVLDKFGSSGAQLTKF